MPSFLYIPFRVISVFILDWRASSKDKGHIAQPAKTLF